MSKKIAVIEDDADLFALLKYNLSKEGFAVVGAQTGRGATELCRREDPRLEAKAPGHLAACWYSERALEAIHV